MAKLWCKLWRETRHDPKLTQVSRVWKSVWYDLMTIPEDGSNTGRLELAAGVPYSDDMLCRELALDMQAWCEMRDYFVLVRMLHYDADGCLVLTHYHKRNATQDPTASARQQDYRARHGFVPASAANGNTTPPTEPENTVNYALLSRARNASPPNARASDARDGDENRPANAKNGPVEPQLDAKDRNLRRESRRKLRRNSHRYIEVEVEEDINSLSTYVDRAAQPPTRPPVKREVKREESKQSAPRRSPAPPPPEIALYRHVLKHNPPKALYDRVVRCLRSREIDPDFLRECYETWVARSYNPANLEGWLFEWYASGRIPDNPNAPHRPSEDAPARNYVPAGYEHLIDH